MATRYYSYLIRLWASETNDELTWRFLLESTECGEKQVFTNLDELLDFFENLIASASLSRGNTGDENTQ